MVCECVMVRVCDGVWWLRVPLYACRHPSTTFFRRGLHVAQLDKNGTRRDFVDYDSNLLAIAAGVASQAQAEAILHRVDSGPCAHPRGTWVSEVYYDAANCNGGNIGDSDITMGRIGWADARARLWLGTPEAAETFSTVLLGPLQADLLSNWLMPERYTCGAKPTHNSYGYIEYPETVAMMIMEVKYGVQFGLGALTVAPLVATDDFVLRIGTVDLTYAPSSVVPFFTAVVEHISFPTMQFRVAGMPPGTYTVQPTGGAAHQVVVGADRTLVFAAATGPGLSVSATRVEQ